MGPRILGDSKKPGDCDMWTTLIVKLVLPGFNMLRVYNFPQV